MLCYSVENWKKPDCYLGFFTSYRPFYELSRPHQVDRLDFDLWCAFHVLQVAPGLLLIEPSKDANEDVNQYAT